MSELESIYNEQAEVVEHIALSSGQYSLRLRTERIAACAYPGQFLHVQCDPVLPMRRPMSILRTDGMDLEVFYKQYGQGMALLADKKIGARLNLLGPIGRPFKLSAYRRRPLLISGGVGMPPVIFLVSHMREYSRDILPLVFMGSEIPFPFKARPSALLLPGLPAHVTASMPLLEDWGIASRLASLRDCPGVYQGFVTDLARLWLDSLNVAERAEVEIFACGPMQMLQATARLARDYVLPCQVALEEYMACGVGGCAGCTVQIHTPSGPVMKRVCVDGPVFESREVCYLD